MHVQEASQNVSFHFDIDLRRLHPERPPALLLGGGLNFCFRLDHRAYRQLASRGELTLGAWLASLLCSRKVYDLVSWTDRLYSLRGRLIGVP